MELFSAVFRMYVLFNVQLFIRGVEALPTFTQKPLSPQNVTEGENVTLIWTYNLDGTLEQVQLRKVVADDNTKVIVNKYQTNIHTITNDFKDRFHVRIISDTETSVTITAIPRSDSGTYRYQITNNNFDGAASEVDISVLYAPNITTFFAGIQTLNESDTLNLTCVADGNPTSSITWIRLADNSAVNSPLTITGKQDEGGYMCIASNGVGRSDNETVIIHVQNYHPIHTTVTTNRTDNTVVVNTTFSVTCSAQANPAAMYRFYKGKQYLNDTNNDAVITTSVSERVKLVNYTCIPFNFYGDGTTGVVTVIVQYAPGNTSLVAYPSNTTVPRNSILALTCDTSASPEAEFHLYFNGIFHKTSNSGMFSVNVEADGAYTCVPKNTVGTGSNATVNVTAVDAPSVTVSSEVNRVVEGNSFILTCNASGKPEPSKTWTEVGSSVVLSTDAQLLIVNVSRTPNNKIKYQCTANNGVGKPVTATATITVRYPAVIINSSNETFTKEVGENVTFSCLRDGYPTPNITWRKDNSEIGWNSSDVTFQVNVTSPGWYRCTVENELNVASKWFHLIVNDNNINLKLTITNRDCGNNLQETLQQCTTKVEAVVKKQISSLEAVKLKTHECGSVTVYLLLAFSQNEDISRVVSVLRNAAAPGSTDFGEFVVDPSSIQAISSDQVPTDASTQGPPTTEGKTTSEKVFESVCDKDKFLPERNCPWSLRFIITIVILGVLLLALICGIPAWWLHKRRKCRKDLRVHSSTSEEQPFSPSNENPYAKVNNGYAKSGPLPTDNIDVEQPQGAAGAAAIPTYAVADKSKKKDKKKDKKHSEQKPPDDQYAVVDKSKKKKKNEPDATFAEVDMSKKSKKPQTRKPGEVLYADLGEFHQMQKMPEVSTSPKPLPPIKRPEPYAETQYADITQFLKGNAEDAGGDPPKEDATLPDSNSSQAPAAGSKEESSAGNTAEGAKANEETLL